jgi:hypothetical protein
MKQDKDYSFHIVVFLVLLVIATNGCSKYSRLVHKRSYYIRNERP